MRKLDWVRQYCAEKLVETVVRWQVNHPDNILVLPVEIMKKRIRAGENMFEVRWTSEDKTFPDTFLACVPSAEFSKAFPSVYKDHLDKLEAKEAAKKKPKKRKEKENIAPKEKKTRSKKVKEVKGQTKIDHFVAKSDPIEVKEPEPEVVLKPKNLVLRRMVSTDPKFNNLILDQQMVTPDTSEIPTDSQRGTENDKTDDYMYKRSPDIINQSSEFTDSMRQYLEDDDDSDLSGIIDEITGVKKHDVQKIRSFSTSTPTGNVSSPSLGAVRQQSCGSPMLRRAQLNALRERNVAKPKASDVFDLSDVSLALDECSTSKDSKKEVSIPDKPYDSLADINFSNEASFDEFDCLDNSRQTPFAERVKKKMM